MSTTSAASPRAPTPRPCMTSSRSGTGERSSRPLIRRDADAAPRWRPRQSPSEVDGGVDRPIRADVKHSPPAGGLFSLPGICTGRARKSAHGARQGREAAQRSGDANQKRRGKARALRATTAPAGPGSEPPAPRSILPHWVRQHDGGRGARGGKGASRRALERKSPTPRRPDAAPQPTKARRACARAGRPAHRQQRQKPVSWIADSRAAAAGRRRPRTAATRSAPRPRNGCGSCSPSRATERTRRRRTRDAQTRGSGARHIGALWPFLRLSERF